MKLTWTALQQGAVLETCRVEVYDLGLPVATVAPLAALETKGPAETKGPVEEPVFLLSPAQESQLEDLAALEPEFPLEDNTLFDELGLLGTSPSECQMFYGCFYSWNPEVCNEDAVNYLKAFSSLGFVLHLAFEATPVLRDNIFFITINSSFPAFKPFESELLIPVRLFKTQNIWRTALIQMVLTYYFLRQLFRESPHKAYLDNNFQEMDLETVKVTKKSVLYCDARKIAGLLFERFVQTL